VHPPLNTLNPKMSRDEIIVGQRLAPEQLQLDIYGELMDAVCLYDKYGTPRRQYRPPPKRNRRHPSVGVSVALHGDNKGLAGINEIWIPDPVSVCSVHERVSCAVAISDAADTPEAISAGYDLTRNRMRRMHL
jgi:hypothetical protein